MSIKNNRILVPKENPYQNDVLSREVLVDQLNALVNNYHDGFVLALNGAWGSGKTTLIEMWSKSLSHTTIYFNAWENDMDRDPFIALMAEIKSAIGEKDDPLFDRIMEHSSDIVSKVIPAVLKGFLQKQIGEETISDIAESFASSSLDIVKKEIETYKKRKDSLHNFKEALSNYVKTKTASKPLVFFIDELDRCRPKYAVELLERLKHLFSVDGIVFVLAIDKEQLEYSIEGFYGTSGINSKEYLRRFFDLEFKIPAPDYERFIRETMKTTGIEDILKDKIRHSSHRYIDEYNDVTVIAKSISEANNLSLRQLVNLLTRLKLVISSQTKTHRDQTLYPGISLFLLVIMEFQYGKYMLLKNGQLNVKDVQGLFHEICKETNFTSDRDIYVLATQELRLISLYDNFSNRTGLRILSIENFSDSTENVSIKSSYQRFLEDNFIKNMVHNPKYDWRQDKLESLFMEVEMFRNIGT